MSEATGLSRIELYVNFERPLTLDERATLRDFVARRGKGEPLQLISGKVPFRYITVLVAPNVLIPRPETEVLVSEAFAELNLPRVADHVAAGENGEEVVSCRGLVHRVGMHCLFDCFGIPSGACSRARHCSRSFGSC